MRLMADHVLGAGSDMMPEPEVVVKGGEGASQRNLVPKAWYTDPFAMLDNLGMGYQPTPSALTYETLRQMAENHAIIASIIQTRMHQVASFTKPQRNKYSIGYRIRHREQDKKLDAGDLKMVRFLENFMRHCGREPGDEDADLTKTVKRMVRDRLTFDSMAIETVSAYDGRPYSFSAVPGSTIRVATPKHRKNSPLHGRDARRTVKYLQVVNNVIVNDYTAHEMTYAVANPRTDLRGWNYGLSELELLVKTVTAHLWAETHNMKAFSQGSTTKGILNVKGNMPAQQFEAFKRQWMTQVSGVTNAWRTPLINSKEDMQWINLQPTNQEMGYSQWLDYLTKIACAVFLIDPAEVNFDLRGGQAAPMFQTTNENQQKASQDRGLRPLLDHIAQTFNRAIIWRFAPHFEFEFVGLDAKTEEQAIELRLKEVQSYKSLNEVRQAEQLPPVPYGDVVANPTYIGYRNQKEMQDAQQAQAGAQGGASGPGMPPGGEPSPEGTALGNKVKQAVGKNDDAAPDKAHGDKLKYAPHVPDRWEGEREEEPWETTYAASVPDEDLRKALEPLRALLR